MEIVCGFILFLGAHMVSGQGDAWLVNITSSIYGLPWNQAEVLANRNSSTFKEEQNFFCGKISDIFQAEPVLGNPVKERYYRCFIDSFQRSNSHTDAPVSFTYALVFNGSGPIPKPVIDGLLVGNTETYHFGSKVWTLIGDWLISRIDVQMARVNLSDYLMADMEGSQHANVDTQTIVDLATELLNFTITPEISDPTSANFTALSSSVCENVSRILLGRFPSYNGCNVTSVVNNSVEGKILMNIRLTFGLEKDVIFPHLVTSIIIEAAPRTVVGNQIALVFGPVMTSEASFLNKYSVRAQDIRDRPDANPCLQGNSNVILPDTSDTSAYIICIRGTYFRFNCAKSQMFDPSTNKCVKRV